MSCRFLFCVVYYMWCRILQTFAKLVLAPSVSVEDVDCGQERPWWSGKIFDTCYKKSYHVSVRRQPCLKDSFFDFGVFETASLYQTFYDVIPQFGTFWGLVAPIWHYLVVFCTYLYVEINIYSCFGPNLYRYMTLTAFIGDWKDIFTDKSANTKQDIRDNELWVFGVSQLASVHDSIVISFKWEER